MNREKLGSRLGFILLSAGCAIGLGNVWKFPYMVGQNGGGLFVLLYLFFLLVIGVPVLAMEFSLGRASQKSPAKLYQELEPKGTKWHLHSPMAVLGSYILMMFYTVVAGWLIKYFVYSAKGEFSGTSVEKVSNQFGNMLSDGSSMAFYTILVIIIGFLVCSFGVKKGLEKITKNMMLLLLGIMIILAINSVFFTEDKGGLEFYLSPNIENIKEIGFIEVIVNAMNQAFFTLSIGMGCMAMFGSYIDRKMSLFGEAICVSLLDTFVAIVSGLIIFPACFANEVPVDSGPSLIFVTLPNVFNQMAFGQVWGSLFFLIFSFCSSFNSIYSI